MSGVLHSIGRVAGVSVLVLGVLLVIDGAHGYIFASSSRIDAFSQVILGIFLISVPSSLFFLSRTIKSYRSHKNEHEMPDTPGRFFLLLLFSSVSMVIALLSIGVYVVVLSTYR